MLFGTPALSAPRQLAIRLATVPLPFRAAWRRLAPAPDVAAALDEIVLDTLEPTALGLSALYAVLAAAHLVTQPPGVHLVMTPVALATAGVLALVAWAIRSRRVGTGVHFAAAAVIGLASGNSFLHLQLTLDPVQSTNFMLVAVGAGALLLSTRWLIAALGTIALSWSLVVVGAPASEKWLHFAFGLAVASVLAVLVHRGRLHSYSRLERARLAFKAASVQDALTGLHNRGHLDAALPRLVAVRRRDGEAARPLSVVLFDLDHFGLVNKERGHAAGDAVLRAVARALGDSVRAGDLVARYGGEEFAVVLESPRDAAAVIAERVRAAVAAMPVAIPGGDSVAVTTSAGVAAWAPDEAAEELLAKADIGLAMAKRAGRNTVVEVG